MAVTAAVSVIAELLTAARALLASAPRLPSHEKRACRVLWRCTMMSIRYSAVFALSIGFATAAAAQPVLPPDFTDTLVASVPSPTALAFTPDGRLLVTTQAGRLRIVQDGLLLSTPALDLSARVCTDSERGLLGVAVDPAFAVNGYIYVFYTFNKSGVCERNTSRSPVNRVSRFILAASNLVDSGSERILIDNIPSPNGNHNGGDLFIGKDGFLYVSVGDGGCDYAGNSGCAGSNDAARDQHSLLGKILRITVDGGIPGSNPFQGADSSRCSLTGGTTAGRKCQETFAWGLRNPFRMAFDPDASGTRFFINDVGQNVSEEIDLGTAGADYGWNVREGMCANGSSTDCGPPPAGMTNPVYAYTHSGGCASITGGAFVPNGIWPASYDPAYLFSDFVCGTIFSLTPVSGGGYTRTTFVTGLGSSSAVTLRFGPRGSGQALYYTTYAGGGQVRAIEFTGIRNRPPVAAAVARPSSGASPLNVTLDASASSDPDGQPLTFQWNFGDGTPGASGAVVSHTYQAGTYTATVTVRDSAGASATASVRVDAGNTAPTPSITSPAAGTTFRVGQSITLQGSATDAQDGSVPASALVWDVTLRHADHTHPFLAATTGSSVTITYPAPEDLAAVGNSFLIVRLTATDSRGLSASVMRELRPRMVNLTIATEPSGLRVTLNDTRVVTGPTTVPSWEGYSIRLAAAAQTTSSGERFAFASWSDGGAASHVITTPASPATYTARFRRAPPFAVPGRIEAEDFNDGGEGIGYHDVSRGNSGGQYRPTDVDIERTTDTGGGYNVGWISAGEWLAYTITVATAGSYRFEARVASNGAGGTFHVEVNGRNVTGPLTVPNTGGWQAWRTIVKGGILLSSGEQALRVVFDSAGSSGAVGNVNVVSLLSESSDVVIYASDIPSTALHGAWRVSSDTTSPNGVKLGTPDAGWSVTEAPLAQPSHYVDVAFSAPAGTYRLWVRLKATANSKYNDSLWAQFSDALIGGSAAYRIGTSAGLLINLEACSGCGVSGWGWQDSSWWLRQSSTVTFAAAGTRVLRLQVREDGVELDQIVLSPVTYRTKAPGALKNDTTILAK